MKAIFISFNQALYDQIIDLMDELGIRGFHLLGDGNRPRVLYRRTALRYPRMAYAQFGDTHIRRRGYHTPISRQAQKDGRGIADARVESLLLGEVADHI